MSASQTQPFRIAGRTKGARILRAVRRPLAPAMTAASSLLPIHRDLEEAAVISGASGLRTARKILAPLVRPAILNGWVWLALISYRELTVATLLFTPRNITLPTAVWNVWSSGNYGVAAAISLVLLSCLMPLILIYYIVGRRTAASSAARGPARI